MKKITASPIKRLIAYIIDGYLSALCMSLSICLFASIYQGKLTIDTTISKLPFSYALTSLIVGIILVYIYYVMPQWIAPTYRGQSLGKRVMHIRIVRTDGKDVRSLTIFLRTVIGIILVEETFNNASFVLRSVLGMVIDNQLVVYLYYAFCIVSLISIIMLFKDPLGQMIHDKIAGTFVIDTKEK